MGILLTKIISYNGISIIAPIRLVVCKKLTSVTVTNGTIGKSAFSFCDNLVNVTIGNGVTEIGQSAFASCYDLNFYCKSLTPPTLGDDALYKPVKIYVPHSVVDKYK